MPIQELCHFTVRRFFGTGKTPSGGFTRADGRVRDRGQPGARARIHERVHADALAWFSNLDAIANPPNGTWFQPSPARYSRIDKSVDCQTAKILPSSTPRDTLTTSVSRASSPGRPAPATIERRGMPISRSRALIAFRGVCCSRTPGALAYTLCICVFVYLCIC